jgi:hypothetical protein
MNTATHPIAPEEVMAFLDGELSAAQAESVYGHVKHCADCSNLAAHLGDTRRRVLAWQVEKFPPAVEAKILAMAEKRFSDPPDVWMSFLSHLRRPWLRPILALSFLGIVVLFSFRNDRQESSVSQRMQGRSVVKPQSSISSMNELSVPATVASALNADVDRYGKSSAADKKETRAKDMSEAFATPDEDAPLAPAPAPIHQPMIARTISLNLVSKDFASSRTSLEAILARHHGYAAQLTAHTAENSQRSINASLRVPAGELGATLVELKSLGHVETEAQSGEEVTQQHADLVARLKNSRETEQRLQAILLQRTGKIADVLAVEQEIARVRGEIEEMEAEQKSLEHRVDFATIELQIAEEYKARLDDAAPSATTRVHNSLVAGYQHAVDLLLGFILFFSEEGPRFLIWLVIFAVPGFFLLRRVRRAVAANV